MGNTTDKGGAELMFTTMVELKGTWRRTDTNTSEVYHFRRIMRRRIRELGGYFEATKKRAWSTPTEQAGTFVVRLPVRRYKSNEYRVARKLFEAIMLQEMCRSPVIKITDTDNWLDRETPPVL
jgi:hypothetical protein